MANDDHIAQLKKGVDAWNAWRDENPVIRPQLSGAELWDANLIGANLSEASLWEAKMSGANLSEAKLIRADLRDAQLWEANIGGADLTGADLVMADLHKANLSKAKLIRAKLLEADLSGANLSKADLSADLTGCRVYGVSAWNLELESAKQQNLVITRKDEPEVTVDRLEVAQFVYLLLHNHKIRDVIDTITSKAVLILGRFTKERKAVLDALREELRKRDYLQAIIPSVRVPVQPLLLEGSSLYSMFKDFDPQDFHWVLPVYRYKEPEQLLATLAEKVIAPTEGKVKALQERWRVCRQQLTAR